MLPCYHVPYSSSSSSSSEEREGGQASSSSTTEGQDVDEYLGGVWKGVKADLGKTLGPEEAKVLETINVRELHVRFMLQLVFWVA